MGFNSGIVQWDCTVGLHSGIAQQDCTVGFQSGIFSRAFQLKDSDLADYPVRIAQWYILTG